DDGSEVADPPAPPISASRAVSADEPVLSRRGPSTTLLLVVAVIVAVGLALAIIGVFMLNGCYRNGDEFVTATAEAQQLARTAADAAVDKLAEDVIAIDVSDRLALSDVFLIVSAPNERQVSAVVDEVEEKIRERGHQRLRREGYHEARWV